MVAASVDAVDAASAAIVAVAVAVAAAVDTVDAVDALAAALTAVLTASAASAAAASAKPWEDLWLPQFRSEGPSIVSKHLKDARQQSPICTCTNHPWRKTHKGNRNSTG